MFDGMRGAGMQEVGARALFLAAAALLIALALLLAALWLLQAPLGGTPVTPELRIWGLPQAGNPEYRAMLRRFAPGLFPDPASDLAEFRAGEARRDSGYAWIDRGAGILRIPVARAMDLIAERGFPRWSFPGVEPGPAAGAARPGPAGLRDGAEP